MRIEHGTMAAFYAVACVIHLIGMTAKRKCKMKTGSRETRIDGRKKNFLSQLQNCST